MESCEIAEVLGATLEGAINQVGPHLARPSNTSKLPALAALRKQSSQYTHVPKIQTTFHLAVFTTNRNT